MTKKNNKNKPVPVDLENIDLDRLKKLSADFPGLIEYAHSAGSFSIVPTQEGAIKGQAMTAMKQQSQMQLDMLFEQVKLLASQVQTIKDRTLISEMIYEAQMKFQPVIGGIYYLYLKNELKVLSLVSPQEWGEETDYQFIAKVELLADHTWKILERNQDIDIY